MRAAVVVFPGSNCDRDCVRALAGLGAEAVSVWHERVDLAGAELVVLPGGFAHGDYLRTGALARFSPVMEAVRRHAAGGGHVVGICNGFQILCEAGMLPGALRRNDGLKFICREVGVSVETASDFTRRAPIGRVLRMPINHFEGNYFCDDATLAHLRARDRIVLRYVDNPNGSRDDIAGIVNDGGNVLGLMPHPERACEALLGSIDGAVVLGSALDAAARRAEEAMPTAVSA